MESNQYQEKRFGKKSLIITAAVILAVAVLCIVGGIVACVNIKNWSRYLLLVVLLLLGLFLLGFGTIMLITTFSMTGLNGAARDVNYCKGTANANLCDKCGRVVGEAEFCPNCGAKQTKEGSANVCPNCQSNNSLDATFCATCGKELK